MTIITSTLTTPTPECECALPVSSRLSAHCHISHTHTPHNESMDLSDEFYFRTSYEPNACDFKETSVEPYTELLDSPPFFSDKGFPADAENDDAALEGMLREAHRVHSHQSHEKTCLSVCRRRQCPTERRDLLSKLARKRRLGLCSTNKNSKFLPSARQKLTDTNFKPLTTEEVY